MYAALVLVFSLLPVGAGIPVRHLDKAAHVCEYLLFAWILTHAVRASHMPEPEYLIWAWIYATSYGLLMEAFQALVPWRSADLYDAAANAIGAALGIWIGRSFPRPSIRIRSTP